jgi:hypothetical protein
MHVKHKITLDNSALTCEETSDKVLVALGHRPDFKLRADNEGDTVHGSVTIIHYDGYCEISVEVYEVDELPDATRKSTLKRPDTIPTQANIKAMLDAIV